MTKLIFPSIENCSDVFIYNTDSSEVINKGMKIETGFLRSLAGIGSRGILIVRENEVVNIALPLICHERKDRMRETEAIGVYTTQGKIEYSKLLEEGGVKIQNETEMVTGGFIGYKKIVAKTYGWFKENSKNIGDILKKDKFAIYFSPVKKGTFYMFKNWNFDEFTEVL